MMISKEEFLRILKGNFDKLPPRIPSEIRIFLSSTFSDLKAERNYLIKNHYEDLREYCLEEHQKDFIMIDMRWGITKEIENQQLTTNICLEEIRKSQQQSAGPSFVAILSHRYGFRGLIPTIDDIEFNLIKDELRKGCDRGKNIELLNRFYELDENNITNKEYKLRGVDEIIKIIKADTNLLKEQKDFLFQKVFETKEMEEICFNEVSEFDATKFDLVKKELETRTDKFTCDLFENIYEKNSKAYILKKKEDVTAEIAKIIKQKQENELIKKMRQSAFNCYCNEKIDKNQKDKYFLSVTELEIRNGILNHTNTHLDSFALIREIDNIPRTNYNTKFIEDEIDASDLLNNLKMKVCKFLGSNDSITLKLDYSKITKLEENTNDIDSQDYLSKFGLFFYEKMKELIIENKKKQNSVDEYTEFDKEILHHGRYCENINNFLHLTNSQNLNQLMVLLEDQKPILVGGSSGAGKTTLMALIAQKIKEKDQNAIIIIRFMGISKESSSIKSILSTIIKQIDEIFGFENRLSSTAEDGNDEKTTKDYYNEIQKLKNILLQKLEDISSKHPEQKVIIILDSIDQLSKQDYSLCWMIYKLPKNVKFIYSVLNNYEKLFERLKEQTNVVEINSMTVKESHSMLNYFLSNSNRKFDPPQQNQVIDRLLGNKETEINPLFIKLLFDISSKWRSSYIVPDEFLECFTIKKLITIYLFNYLERKYGEVLFSHCIFYLTLFEYRGISESELEDILSIDDDVLTEVFEHHHPPVRRFPIALWLNIKYELKDYITNKETDGMSVISWYHRAFIEASKEYCDSKFLSSNVKKDNLIMNVIDYFTEKWNKIKSDCSAGDMKEFRFKKSKLNNFQIKSEIGKDIVYSAYRNTKLQILKKTVYQDGNEYIKYNRRKLNEFVNLINMLSKEKMKIDLLKEHVYFNYEFMFCKAKLKVLEFVIEMHDNLCKLNINNEELSELIQVSEIYKSQLAAIENDPESIIFKVISRMESRSKYVEQLAAPSHLLLLRSFVEKDFVNDLFKVSGKCSIKNYYIINNEPYLFVLTGHEYLDDFENVLFLINSKNQTRIGEIALSHEPKNIQIIINEHIKKLDNINDLNASMFFNSNNSFYFSDLKNSPVLIKTYDENIKYILAFNFNTIAVVVLTEVVLYKIDKGFKVTELEAKYDQKSEIALVKTTVPDNTVFTPSCFNNVEFITVLIGFNNNIIKVYRICKLGQELKLFCKIDNFVWNLSSKTRLSALVIANSHSIENCNEGYEKIARFAIEAENIIRVIDVECEDHWILVDEVDMTKLNLKNKKQDGFSILCLYQDKIVISEEIQATAYDLVTNNIYLYDLETKKVLEICDESFNEIYYLPENRLLATKDYFTIKLFTIDEYKLDLMKSIEIGMLDRKSDLREMGNKLIAFERQSLKEIDYLSIKDDDPLLKISPKIKQIYSQLDSKYLIAALHNDGKTAYDSGHICAVIDIATQNIIEKTYCSSVIDANSEYIVLLKANKSEKILSIYEISYQNQSFSFIQIHQEIIDKNMNWVKNNKCYFDESDKNKFIVQLFNEEDEYFEIKFIKKIECSQNTSCNSNSFKIYLKQFKGVSGDLNTITSLNKYFVLWELDKQFIIIIDIKTAKLIAKEIIEKTYFDNKSYGVNEIMDIINIQKTDDLIVLTRCQERRMVYLFSFIHEKLEFERKVIFEELSKYEIQSMNIISGYFFIGTNEKTYLYHTSDLKQEKYPLEIAIDKASKHLKFWSCVSLDNKYFIFITNTNELCVYELKNPAKLVASLKLDLEMKKGIFASEEYVLGVYDGPKERILLTFQIK